MLDIAADHGGPRNDIGVGYGVEEGAGFSEAAGAAEEAGKHGVVGGGVAEGHSVEEVSGAEGEVVEKVGGDEGVEGDDGALRHSVEDPLGFIDATETAVAVNKRVGAEDGRCSGGSQAERCEPHRCVVVAVNKDHQK